VDNPPSLHRYTYAHARPTRFVDLNGNEAGDLWDPRTYFAENAREGAWQGLKEGYVENALEVGDSIGALGKGAYKAGEGVVVGTLGVAAGAVKLQADVAIGATEMLVTGDPTRLHDTLSDAASIGEGVVQELGTTLRVAKEAYANPGLALDAATELGIEGTSEVLGGAVFETATIVAPLPKAVGIVKEMRRGARVARIGATRSAFSGTTAAERVGLKFTTRRVEKLGFRLRGSIKASGNQGIDLAFDRTARGVLKGRSKLAFAEAKKSASRSSLKTDRLGIRQGSFDFFDTRLSRAGRLDLRGQLRAGKADLYGGFAGRNPPQTGRLFQFNADVFKTYVNFAKEPGAAKLIPK
jgi:hypothetical protein